jgi:hypothetical protein
MRVTPEYDRESKLTFQSSTADINAELFAFKSQRFLPLNLSDSSYVITDPALANCSIASFHAWISACHGQPLNADKTNFRDILLFSKFWGTPDIATELCQITSQGLGFDDLLILLKCAIELNMPTDLLEDRVRLSIGANLRPSELANLPLPVLVRLLDVPWKDEEIEKLLAFLLECWNLFGEKSAPLFSTLDSVELTSGQLERLIGAGVDLTFCSRMAASVLYTQERFLEKTSEEFQVLKGRLGS